MTRRGAKDSLRRSGPGRDGGSARKSAALEIEPPLASFAKGYAEGAPQVVWTRLVSDLETPVSAYLKVAHGRPMSFLLESVEGGAVRGRYSMIGLAPDIVWRADGDTAEISRTPDKRHDAFKPVRQPTIAALRALLAESAIELPEDLPPMAAGVFGYMGYDTVRLIERLPDMPPDALGVPDMVLMRPTIIVVFDGVKDEMTVVTPVRPAPGQGPEKAYAAARKRLEAVVAGLEAPLAHTVASATAPAMPPPDPVSNTTSAEFVAMVGKAKDYIRAGDAFQIVLSQRFSAPFTLPPFALYRALRRTNPSPFLFHLDLGSFALVDRKSTRLNSSHLGISYAVF